MIFSNGLLGVSIQIPLVFGRMAAFTFAMSCMLTNENCSPCSVRTFANRRYVSAVDVVTGDDVIARLEQVHRCGDGGHPVAGRPAIDPAFEAARFSSRARRVDSRCGCSRTPCSSSGCPTRTSKRCRSASCSC